MRIALAVTLALLLAPAAWCQSFGVWSLTVQPNARSAGMGDCTIAVIDDASASSWNPGGLAFMQGDISIAGVYSRVLPDWDDMHYWYGAGAVRVADKAVVAASVTYLSYGERQLTDDDGYQGSVYHSYEVAPSIALAAAIGEYVGVGMNLKYVKVHLAPTPATIEERELEGTVFAADVGVEGRAGFDLGDLDVLLRAGGAIQNMGSDLEFVDVEQTDPLPKSMRLGASGQLSYGRAGHALLCGQYEKSLIGGFDNDSSGVWGFGGEVQASVLGLISQMEGRAGSGIRDLLTARIGYVDDEDGEVEGWSYGFGVGVEMDERVLLSLDFARVPQYEDLTEPWRIGGSGWFTF